MHSKSEAGEIVVYQPVPGDVQEKLLKAYLEEEKED